MAAVYPSLNWDPGQQSEASLDAVFRSSQLHAIKAIKWYQESRRPQRRWARLLRFGALLFAGIAGLLPIVSQILLSLSREDISISPAWATVALALAAGLIAFDRFFGCSSSWLRYSVADGRLQELLRAFQLDWQIASEARKAAGANTQEDLVAVMLKRARAFELDLQAVIRQETEAWRQEFQSTLKQIDETAHASRPSTLAVEVPPRSDVEVSEKVVVRPDASRPLPPPDTGSVSH